MLKATGKAYRRAKALRRELTLPEESVVRLVSEHARERAPLHQPSAGPPPPAELGED
ncbi:MAG: hypothetical protein WDN44_01070 [Sphingomonas sp.]